MTTRTRRHVTDCRPCRKPRRDRGMFALGMICFVASGPVIYAGAVAALELGLFMGAAGFLLAVGLWILGVACVGEERA